MEKIYEVWVKNYTDRGAAAMGKAMDIDGYRIRPAKVAVLWQENGLAKLRVTIHEGRNRQIRKMAAACGMTVTRLRRIAEGPLQLGELPKGQWRYLTETEQDLLGVIKMH